MTISHVFTILYGLFFTVCGLALLVGYNMVLTARLKKQQHENERLMAPFTKLTEFREMNKKAAND